MFKVMDCADVWPGEYPDPVFVAPTEAACREWIDAHGVENEWHSRGDYAVINPDGKAVFDRSIDILQDVPF